MKTLHLILKRKWFEMIASGEKKEEYRDMTPYWFNRLMDCRVRKTAELSKRYFGTDGKTANIEVLLEDLKRSKQTLFGLDAKEIINRELNLNL